MKTCGIFTSGWWGLEESKQKEGDDCGKDDSKAAAFLR
jgi:hypothetical protein